MTFNTLSPSAVSALRRGTYVAHVRTRVWVPDPDPNDPGNVNHRGHWEWGTEDVTHDEEDIFVVGRDGGIYTSAVLDHSGWNGWGRIEDRNYPDRFTASPQSIISSIKRDDHQEDIFVVGRDGGVYTNWVVDQGAFNQWIRIADNNFPDGFTVELQSPVTTVKRDEHQQDIFVVGRDGGVYTNWVVDHGHWNKWIRLADNNFPDGFTAVPQANIAAIKRDDHQEDIFVVGRDGGVYTNWVVDHDHWNEWIRLADNNFPDGFTAAPRAAVATVKRDEHQQDIFVVGRDGGVYTNWVVDHGSWNKWFRISERNFTTPQSDVTVIKRDDHQEDIFIVGRDGGVYTNWVVDHGHWNKWIRLADRNFPDGFTAAPGSTVAAVKRDDHQEDIFVVGRDGVIYTNWVVDHGPWNEWFAIS